MKNKKILMAVVLAFFLFVSMINVGAKACDSISKEKKCNKQSSCKWYSNKCYTKSDAQNKCTKDCSSRSTNETVVYQCLKQSCGIDVDKLAEEKQNCESKCETKNAGNSSAISSCKKSCGTASVKVITSKNAKNNINTSDEVNFCASTAKIWKIIGMIFTIFKIIIPIILIILGSVDLARAIFDKEDGIIKAAKRLLFRFLSAIIIFLLPSLVTTVIGLFLGFKDDKTIREDYEYCKTCIVSPGSCDTSKDASKGNTLDS